MENDAQTRRRAAAARDEAMRRVRRVTAAVLAGSAALTGVFAGIAASSTGSNKPAATGTVRGNAVTAPQPALVQNGSDATSPPAATTTTTATPPAASESSPPVVVSGGS